MHDVSRDSLDDGQESHPRRELLPSNVRPLHYKLTFEPDLLGKAETFQGMVSIDLFVLERTKSISLHAVDLDIDKTEVVTGNGSVIGVSGVETNKSKSVITVELEHAVPAPSTLQLRQKFTGSLLHHGFGFFRAPVKKADSGAQWMASTQFEPNGARQAFPCFDEPALKATFDVTLISEPQFTRLGNMDVSHEMEITSDGKPKIATTFNTTPLMSTYILAFAIGELNYLETDQFRVPIRCYAAKYLDISQTKQALVTAARCLEYFEKTFDMAFPLPKVDMIAVPGNRGAMENWGLVTYEEFYLFADKDNSSVSVKQRTSSGIVHELAHQWFGNIVTMKYWDGLWLNEGFASWAETYAWKELEPEWEMENGFVSQRYQQALAMDSIKGSHPIEIVIKKDSDVNQIFDNITYAKGQSVIRMFSGILGEQDFIKGISHYLKKHSYGSCVTEDLWESLSDVVGHDIGKMLSPWTRSVGYPVVHVDEDEETGHISLTQQRFLSGGTSDPEDDDAIYPVPILLKSEKGIDKDVFMTGRSMKLPLPKDFFKLNANQVGFYRVAYSPSRVLTLGDNARDGLLSVSDKIGILSDAFSLAAGGCKDAKTSTALALLEKFSNETSYFVWVHMINCINGVLDAWAFQSDSVISSIKAFKKKLVHTKLMEIGWEFDKNDSDQLYMLKSLLFANSADESQVSKAAKGMFDKFIWGNNKALNSNLQQAVFSVVLANGGVQEYNALLQIFSDTSRVELRTNIIDSLGSARDPDVISHVLALSLSPDVIARNETYKLLAPLAKHRQGKEALWAWFVENYDKVVKSVGSALGLLAGVVKTCVGGLGTKEQYEEVKKFFKGKDTEEFDKSLAQSLDQILGRTRWVERDGEDVTDWLKQNGY
ncbi:MAG: hypothetical protein Q9227_002939 [Pyrenula ochraceoflavens]